MIQRQAQAILPQRQFAFAHILPRDEALAVFGWRDAAVFIKGGDQILVCEELKDLIHQGT